MLSNEDKYPANIPALWLRATIEENNVAHIPLGLCDLKSPAQCKCFVVNMMLQDEASGYKDLISILLPGPTAEAWHQFETIQKHLDDGISNQLTVSMAHVVGYSILDNKPAGYRQSWEELQASLGCNDIDPR